MLSYLLSFFISLILTPIVIKLNKKLELLETPGATKIHTSPIAKFGGLAVFISTLPFVHYISNLEFNILIYISYSIIVATGIIDDYKPLNAYIKILLQLFAIIIIILFLYNNGVFNDINKLLLICVICIIIFWFLFCTNSINLIDGLDSLACGISIMILAYLAYLFYTSDEIYLAQYCLILLAGIWGFLIFNFSPAEIILGDTGSLYIGFNISLLTTLYFIKYPSLNSFFIICTICTIPIFDSLYAIIRRIIKKTSPFKGDLEHIHHKLYFVCHDGNLVIIILFTLQIIIVVFLITFDNVMTISKITLIYVFSLIYLISSLKLLKKFKKNYNEYKIARPTPTELTIFFIVELLCLSYILIPQWVVIIFFVFLFVPFVALFSYERLKYILNVVLMFTVYLLFINYKDHNIKSIGLITLLLIIIFMWSSNKIHYKNIININSDDLLFVFGLILAILFTNLTLINSSILALFSITFYFYNKKYLLLL
jgi:UDP-GlcNAc:undecaprenyl-phosphate GlcNAc-1-phosphate transferase